MPPSKNNNSKKSTSAAKKKSTLTSILKKAAPPQPPSKPAPKPSKPKKKEVYSESDTDSESESEDEAYRKKQEKNKKKSKKKPIRIDSSSPDSDYDSEKEYQRKKKQTSKKKPVYSSDSDSDSEEEYQRRRGRHYSDSDYSSDEEQDKRSQQLQPKSTPGFEIPDKPAIYMLVGTPGSGKSHCIRYLLYQYCLKEYFTGGGIVFSQTAKFNGDYDFLPERCIMQYDEEVLQKYIGHLRAVKEKGVKEHGRGWDLKPNFVILDDVLGQLMETSFFNNWIATFRHTNTTIFMANQYINASRSGSTLLRECVRYAFMWPTIFRNSVVGMYNAFGGLYKNVHEFKQVLIKCQEKPHQFLLYKAGEWDKEGTYSFALAGDIPNDFKMKF